MDKWNKNRLHRMPVLTSLCCPKALFAGPDLLSLAWVHTSSQVLILSSKSLQRTGRGLFLCCKPVSVSQEELWALPNTRQGEECACFIAGGIYGWQILLAQALGLQLCVRTVSPGRFTAAPPHKGASHLTACSTPSKLLSLISAGKYEGTMLK